MDKQSNPLSDTIQRGVARIKEMMANPDDIITVIEEDHQPLKELIQVMKDIDRPLNDRIQAFKEFAPLLITHAKAEEKSLYDFMKTRSSLRQFGFEGETEHTLADQLSEETERASNPDELGAKIKVLAELVEHHVQEEERDILPAVKSEVSEETLKGLTKIYVRMQEQIIAAGQDDSPHEAELSPADRKH